MVRRFKVPRYYYKCGSCGEIFDSYVGISKRNEMQLCKCGFYGQRNPEAELAAMGRLKAGGDKVRLSRAMAIHKSQVGNAMRRWPGSEYTTPNEKGICQLVIHNRREKLQRAKERNLTELE